MFIDATVPFTHVNVAALLARETAVFYSLDDWGALGAGQYTGESPISLGILVNLQLTISLILLIISPSF